MNTILLTANGPSVGAMMVLATEAILVTLWLMGHTFD
jgi:hypothetical protein